MYILSAEPFWYYNHISCSDHIVPTSQKQHEIEDGSAKIVASSRKIPAVDSSRNEGKLSSIDVSSNQHQQQVRNSHYTSSSSNDYDESSFSTFHFLDRIHSAIPGNALPGSPINVPFEDSEAGVLFMANEITRYYEMAGRRPGPPSTDPSLFLKREDNDNDTDTDGESGYVSTTEHSWNAFLINNSTQNSTPAQSKISKTPSEAELLQCHPRNIYTDISSSKSHLGTLSMDDPYTSCRDTRRRKRPKYQVINDIEALLELATQGRSLFERMMTAIIEQANAVARISLTKISESSENINNDPSHKSKRRKRKRKSLSSFASPSSLKTLPPIEFLGCRVKGRQRLAEKVDNEPIGDTIADYLGGRVIVRSPKGLRALMDTIPAYFNVLSYHNSLVTPDLWAMGYRAIHLQVVAHKCVCYNQLQSNSYEGLGHLAVCDEIVRQIADRDAVSREKRAKKWQRRWRRSLHCIRKTLYNNISCKERQSFADSIIQSISSGNERSTCAALGARAKLLVTNPLHLLSTELQILPDTVAEVQNRFRPLYVQWRVLQKRYQTGRCSYKKNIYNESGRCDKENDEAMSADQVLQMKKDYDLMRQAYREAYETWRQRT